MLKGISTITVTTTSISECERAYGHYFNYQTISQGTITADMAAAWQAPVMAGHDFTLLASSSGYPCFVRFIEIDDPASQNPGDKLRHPPMSTCGWSAMEIIVSDVDALAVELTSSPFRIIGPPANLSFSDDIRAMQVLGPAGELLYLTEAKAPVPGFNLPVARTWVDHPFIVILGGTSLTALKAYYQNTLGLPDSPDTEARVSTLSAAFALPRETLHLITAIPLAQQGYLEIDQFPQEAVARIGSAGQLPPGIAMVSFYVAGLPPDAASDAVRLLSNEAPYSGQPAALLTGPANELIELIESPSQHGKLH